MFNNFQLTPHFSLNEFLVTSSFNGEGIIHNCNSLTLDIFNNIQNMCIELEKIRSLAKCPLHINSGYRCDMVNRAVGGVANSDHIKGLAVDISLSASNRSAICNAIRDYNNKYSKPLRYIEGHPNYIHISFKSFNYEETF